jgi:hypothetical protein
VHALADDMTELDISARENMEQDAGISTARVNQSQTTAPTTNQTTQNCKPPFATD